MARPKLERYVVDGDPDEPEKSYADMGAAISCSLTRAEVAARKGLDKTFYVRDSIGGDTVGYSESDGKRKTSSTTVFVKVKNSRFAKVKNSR